MSKLTRPSPPPARTGFLWQQPVCDCHYYYQYYLCGCPDRWIPEQGSRAQHKPSFQGCAIWYSPFPARLQHHNLGFRHNSRPGIRPKPSVLPFPCYRHLTESRVLLSPEELRATRRRLLPARWNPVSVARLNRNRDALQRFQEEGNSWARNKRVRVDDDDEDDGDEDDGLRPSPPRRRRILGPEPGLKALGKRFKALLLQRREWDRFNPQDEFLGQYFPAPPAYREDAEPLDRPAPTAQEIEEARLEVEELYRTFWDHFPNDAADDALDAFHHKMERLRSILRFGEPPSPLFSPIHPAQARATQQEPDAQEGEEQEIEAHKHQQDELSFLPPGYMSEWDFDPDALRPLLTGETHFTSLAWLTEEQSVDLWRLDGYRWRCRLPPPVGRLLEAGKKKEGEEGDVRYDGPSHTGYFAGAYRMDPEVVHQVRVASWERGFGIVGVLWARKIKELWADFVDGGGGLWMGGWLDMGKLEM